MLGGLAFVYADVSAPRLVPELTAPFSQTKDQASDAPSAMDSWASRKKTVAIQGGAPGGPTGVAGMSFEYAPVPWLVAGAGGGFTGHGPTGAVWPRLRLPLSRWIAVGFGVPMSAGPYEAMVQQPERCSFAGCPVGYRTTRDWDMAFWVHAEPNVEIRLPQGMALRLYGGESFLLNTRSDQCSSTLPRGCPSAIGERQWYGGVALGYAW